MSKLASREVIETVAEAEGVDPVDLEPLSETVDVDSLDKLISRTNSPCQFKFYYYGYRILVEQDNGISVIIVDKE